MREGQPQPPEPEAHFTRRQKAVFVAIYLIGCFLLLEFAARVILAAEGLSGQAALRSSVGWRHWWAERHQPGVPIFYGFDDYHPTRGWASRPLVRGDDTFGPDSVNTNSIGLRGTTEFALEKDPGRLRIAILGDSFTFGDEVRDDETYPSVLARRLAPAEVMNFGVHGYGHDQMLLLLREKVLDHRPDVVVLGFLRDDMERNMLSFRDFAKPRFRLKDGRLRLTNVPVPTPDQVRARARWRSRLFDLLLILRDNYFWKSGYNDRRMEQLTAAILDAIVGESIAGGAVVILAYLPHSEELVDRERQTDGYRFFKDYCARRAAFCVDLLPEFLEAIDGGTPVRSPGHWHGNGHRVAAEGLERYLLDRGLLDRSPAEGPSGLPE